MELAVVLAGVRPEEVTEWSRELPNVPVSGGGFDLSPDLAAQAAYDIGIPPALCRAASPVSSLLSRGHSARTGQRTTIRADKHAGMVPRASVEGA